MAATGNGSSIAQAAVGRGAPPLGPSSPLPGLGFRRTANGIAVARVHWSADPDKTQAWAEKEFAGYTDKAFWLQEMEIQYDARDGQRVYPEFDTSVHVITREEMPPRMTRYMAIDPHPRTPHAMLWVGIDQWSDWYVYRELWPSIICGLPKALKDTDEENSFTIRDYAETMAVLEGNELEWHNPETDREYGIYRMRAGGEKIVYRFMDQAGKAFRATGEGQQAESYAQRYARFGVQCQDPLKKHEAGEDAIRKLLKPRKHDIRGTWPKLHISADCPELILEFQKYKYKSMKRLNAEKELYQDGVEARCHLLDDLRYLATADIGYIPTMVS